MQDVLSIHIRRGGINKGQSHSEWLSTISESPNVISMSFVPIASLLSGVKGSGFLSHAINLYLRCKYSLCELSFLLNRRVFIAFWLVSLCFYVNKWVLKGQACHLSLERNLKNSVMQINHNIRNFNFQHQKQFWI